VHHVIVRSAGQTEATRVTSSRLWEWCLWRCTDCVAGYSHSRNVYIRYTLCRPSAVPASALSLPFATHSSVRLSVCLHRTVLQLLLWIPDILHRHFLSLDICYTSCIIRLQLVMVKMTTRRLACHVWKDTLVIVRYDEVVTGCQHCSVWYSSRLEDQNISKSGLQGHFLAWVVTPRYC